MQQNRTQYIIFFQFHEALERIQIHCAMAGLQLSLKSHIRTISWTLCDTIYV